MNKWTNSHGSDKYFFKRFKNEKYSIVTQNFGKKDFGGFNKIEVLK